nr:PREDICTED: nucleic-acid-binding protein from mobile element jockey-like [Bemisia tabaci]
MSKDSGGARRRVKPPLRCKHKILGYECDECSVLENPCCEHFVPFQSCERCFTKFSWSGPWTTIYKCASNSDDESDVFQPKKSAKNLFTAIDTKQASGASNAVKEKVNSGHKSKDSCILGPASIQTQPMDSTPSDPAWKLVVSKRKTRHDPDSPVKVPPKKTKDKRQPSVNVPSSSNSSNNKFSALGIEKPETKDRVPPPILVSFVADPSKFKSMVVDLIDKNAFIKIVNKSQVKIKASSTSKYDELISSFIQNKDVKFHTYKKANEKTIRAVVRGLPADFSVDKIKSAFEGKFKGLIVKNVSQVRHQITKSPQPLFFVDFLSNNLVSKVWDVKSIQDFIVSVERPKGRREVIQCKNCLAFGHARSSCYRDPRCLLCGDFHALSDCPRPEEFNKILLPVYPTCVHCGEMHAGNYKGCKVYKQIRKKRSGKKVKATETKFANHQFVPSRNLTTQGKSYAQVLAGNTESKNKTVSNTQSVINVQVPNISDKRIKTLEELVIKQSEQIERMMKVIEAFLPALLRGASLSIP